MKNILLLIITIVCASCTGSLDRNQAENIITDHFHYPRIERNLFEQLDYPLLGNTEPYKPLVLNGFLEGTQMQNWAFVSPKLRLTEKGKIFVIDGQLATSFLRIKEITGLRFDNTDKTSASVEYTITRYAVTPFGKLKGYNVGDEIKEKIYLQKYDDGWRVARSKNNSHYGVKDYPEIERLTNEFQ